MHLERTQQRGVEVQRQQRVNDGHRVLLEDQARVEVCRDCLHLWTYKMYHMSVHNSCDDNSLTQLCMSNAWDATDSRLCASSDCQSMDKRQFHGIRERSPSRARASARRSWW